MAEIFLLLGPEVGEKELFIQNIRKKIEARFKGQWEESFYYPFDIDMNDWISSLKNGSLFVKHRLVILKQADAVKKKNDVKKLADFMKNPQKNVTLLLSSDEIGIDKALEKAVPSSCKKIFWEMFESRKKDWIFQFFRQRNRPVDGATVDLLLELVENQTEALKEACQRLVAATEEQQSISEDFVENFIYHSKEENVFTLFHKLCERNLELCLEVLHKILLSRQAQGVQVINGLIWQIKKLVIFKELSLRRFPEAEIWKEAGIRGKRNQKLYAQAKNRYSLEDLQYMVQQGAACDSLLRSSRTDMHQLILERFFIAIIQGKRGSSSL